MARVAKNLMKAWPVALTAALHMLAFPPFNLGLLVLVALVPWLASLAKTDDKGAFRGGYLLGVLHWAAQMGWVVMLTERWTGNIWLGLAPLFVICFLGAFYFGLIGWLMHRAIVRGWIWAIPVLWAGLEVARSFIPTLAYPYALIATPLWRIPELIQLGYFGTIYLVGAWVVLVNVLLYLWLAKVPQAARQHWRLLVFAIALPLLGFVRLMEPPEGKLTKVVAGQPGVDLAFTREPERSNRLLGSVAYLYQQAQQFNAQLLVLPEGVSRGINDDPPVTPFAVQPTPAVLFGGHRAEMRGSIGAQQPRGTASQPAFYQSAFSYDGKWRHADKARLVVFGEYVPLRGVLPFLDSFKLPMGDLTPAERTSAIQANGLKVGPLICFEGLFFDVAEAQVRNGAQLLAVMAIDDWYMGTPAPDQLRTAAVWRAVETGLPVVRAGGLGHSMVIDSRGRVLKEAALGKTVALTANLHVPDAPPPAGVRPFMPWILLGGFLALWAGLVAPKRKGAA